jgi:hypothetical protein
MADQHTPGPWKINRRLSINPNVVICGADGVAVLQTLGGNDEANGVLAEAAPDMLALLRECSIVLSDVYTKHRHPVIAKDLQTFLAKLDGETE